MTTPDSSRGVVSVSVYDCRGDLAPDVAITTDVDGGGVVRLIGLNPNPTATTTDTTGIETLVNVPTGVLTLAAIPAALGKPSSQATVNVQANIVDRGPDVPHAAAVTLATPPR